MERSDKITAEIMAILSKEDYDVQNLVLSNCTNAIRDSREKALDLAQLSVDQAKKILLSTPVLSEMQESPVELKGVQCD